MAKHRKKQRRLRERRQNPAGRPTSIVTPSDLVDGRAGPGQTTLRLARPGEAEYVARLSAMAGVVLEPPLAAAIGNGRVATAIVNALAGESRALVTQLATMITSDHPASELAPLAVVLVAVRDGKPVAALLAYPPFSVIAQGISGGIPVPQMAVLGAAVTRIKALGVNPTDRRGGIGSALMHTALRLYGQLGYLLIYGQIRAADDLDGYYRRFGFKILDLGTAIRLDRLGVPMGIAPEPGEQLIVQWA